MDNTLDETTGGSVPGDPDRALIARELGAQYQIIRPLGRGAMGAVYLARDRVLHRLVAIKALRCDRFGDPTERERFRGEARLSVQLSHPGIVPVYTFGETPSLLYAVMQYLEGGSLAERVERSGGRLSPDDTRRVLLELADVLDYAHRQGVVHRDVKPENVLLAGTGPTVRAVLGDFGIAAQPFRDRGAGRSAEAAGTAHYMSPEQLWGTIDVDRRSDVYALGVLGYRLLAGRVPYGGANPASVAARRATAPHTPLHLAAPNAPRALCDVIERCLEQEPERRWRNARELHAALLRASTRQPLWSRLARRARPPRQKGARSSPPGGRRSRVRTHPSSRASLPGAATIAGLRRDVRTAVRGLRRAPGFVAIAVLCLALGIGANAAVFSVVNAVLLRPLPYPAAERVVRVNETSNFGAGLGSVSVPNYRDWVAQARSFDHLAAFSGGSFSLGDGGDAERLRSVAASANLFALLGVPALHGRTFAPGEDSAGRARVAVLGAGLWQRRFGADPKVVGRTVRLDDVPHTVIGVMPASFSFPRTLPTDVWVPLVHTPEAEAARGSHFLQVVGRLRHGATVESATADLARVSERIRQANPDVEPGRGARVVTAHESVVGQVRPALLVLFGAVAVVLLIACANVANLYLARAATRRHEVAVRLALGASRARLVRQYLVESVILALGGAVFGVLLAWAGLRAIAQLAERALPVSDGGIPIDARVLAFLLVVAVASAVGFGLVPALQSSGTDLRESLADAGTKTTAGGRQQRLRSTLVVAEIALSLVLLVGAGLLVRGFRLLQGVEPGLARDNVLTAHVAVPSSKYPGGDAAARLLRPLLERVREIPGVRSAGVTTLLPIQQAGSNDSFTVEGAPEPARGREPWAEVRVTSPGFFGSLGIPLNAGRLLTEDDGTRGPPAVVVNETLARRHFAGGPPVGRRIVVDSVPYTVVGVVGDVRSAGLEQQPLAELYFSYADTAQRRWMGDMTIVVKTAVPPASVAGALRAAVRGVDPGRPLYRIMTMDEVVATSLADRRLNLVLLGLFAAVAVVLAAAGLYGVIAYLVTQRTREMGIRMALGARASDVVRLVMRQGAGLAALGVALGLVGAVALTRLLAGLLYGVEPRDPLTFAAVALLLGAVALAATYAPARRASRADPMLTIRSE